MVAVEELQTIGRSVPKADAWLKATGSAQYAGDTRLPGMLEAKVLRSPYPHARIVAIDTGAAEALLGVYAVVTGHDVPHERIGDGIGDHYAIVREKATFVGEAVAAVAAVDEETAERALALINVAYEPLPAVFDAAVALRADAPLVHPDLASYKGFRPSPPLPASWRPPSPGSSAGADVAGLSQGERRGSLGADSAGLAQGELHRQGPGNLRSRVVFERGDVDAALREPDLVVHEETYVTPRQFPVSMEPHAAVAQVDPTGKVMIWATTKAPFRARGSVAETLGIPISRVRLIAPVIGGDFGGKGGGFIDPIVALLARKAGRPVRLALSRVEEFTAMISRPGDTIRLKIGARRDGIFVALEAEALSNLGAVDDYGPDRPARPASLIGSYRIPNVRAATTAVYTNTSPAGHVRAPAGPQNHFALESHVDALARKLGMDPFELRLKNIVRDGDSSPSGSGIMRNSGLEECIARARSWASRLPAPGPNQGIGVAIGSWALGPKLATSASAATVKVDVDGSVVVLTGAADQGGGQWSVVAQVASEVLGVGLERVSVIAADTEATPYETGIGGSNATYRVGNSVRQAAEDARRRLLREAAQLMEVDEEELIVRNGRVARRNGSGDGKSIAEIARPAVSSPDGAIIGNSMPIRAEEIAHHGREQAETVDAPSFSCHVAQVRVDPETGIVDVERYFAAQDVGRALNPMNCEGQVQGGVVFGLGFALTEEMVVEEGTPVNANLWEYLVPTAPHVPDLTVELVEVPSTYGPFGAKGIGENPCIPVAAAVANAVYDAVGARVTRAPLTPERVLAALGGSHS